MPKDACMALCLLLQLRLKDVLALVLVPPPRLSLLYAPVNGLQIFLFYPQLAVTFDLLEEEKGHA